MDTPTLDAHVYAVLGKSAPGKPKMLSQEFVWRLDALAGCLSAHDGATPVGTHFLEKVSFTGKHDELRVHKVFMRK